MTSHILLRHSLTSIDAVENTPSLSRRLVHQATGMVMARLAISADDAVLLIQARVQRDAARRGIPR